MNPATSGPATSGDGVITHVRATIVRSEPMVVLGRKCVLGIVNVTHHLKPQTAREYASNLMEACNIITAEAEGLRREGEIERSNMAFERLSDLLCLSNEIHKAADLAEELVR